MTVLHAVIFVIGFLGFMCLAVAMPKHSKHLLRRELSPPLRRIIRVAGWLLIGTALTLGIYGWRLGIGMVTWLGGLSVAGVLLVFFMPRWPWQPDTAKRPEKIKRKTTSKPDSATIAPRLSPVQLVAITVALLIPAASFAWQLMSTPQKPLLRDDAVHSEIGEWSFVIAEKDLKAPDLVAFDVPVKQFSIRFCDGCEREIRAAYLKIRQPRSVKTAGNGFGGRGLEKTADITIPRAAKLDDGIWLTVEGTDGAVFQQAFGIAQLSPALADFIANRR